MRRTWASTSPSGWSAGPAEAGEPLVPFSFWGPTCDTIDFMQGPFQLPATVKEGDYIEIGNTGAYGRAIAGRFNGYGAFDEAILLDEPMLTMYPATREAERAQTAERRSRSRRERELEYLPAEQSFLDPVRADADDPGAARAVVIPFGLEASVSYGGGTAAGPAAILKASQQLELYDEELGASPISTTASRRCASPRSRGPSRRRSTSSPASSRRCWSRASFRSCWAASIR